MIREAGHCNPQPGTRDTYHATLVLLDPAGDPSASIARRTTVGHDLDLGWITGRLQPCRMPARCALG